MSSPKVELQSEPVLQEQPSLQQKQSGTQMITDNVGEEKQFSEKNNKNSPYQSEDFTRYGSEDDVKKVEAPKGTVLTATAQILKSGVGTGILFLPSVFKSCGIVLSIVFMVLCSFICYFCWSLISKIIRFQESTDRTDPTNKNLTLEACAGHLYGQRFKNFLTFATMIYCYVACFGYCIFIYKTLNETLPNHMITMAIMFGIYIPFSMYKRIDKLSILTYLALSATIITLLIIIGKSCNVINTTEIIMSNLNEFDITQLPLQFGVFTFAYDCNGVYTECHASMKDKSRFNTVLKFYLVIFTLLGILVGTMGYVAFGASTSSVIFDNIGSMNGVGTTLGFLYSIAELASILLYIFNVVKFFDRTINTYIIKNTTKFMSFFQELATRAVIFFSFSWLALYITQISAVFNLMGCVLCTLLTYICPLILYVKAKAKQDSILKKVQQEDIEKPAAKQESNIEFLDTSKTVTGIAIFCLLFGLLGGISGFVSTIISLKNGDS